MIELNFKEYHSSNFGKILKPIIPVRIVGPEYSANLNLLIDSGADLSMIPYSVGKTLGFEIDLINRKEVKAIGEGSVSYILVNTEIIIEDIKLQVLLAWSLIEEVPLILGRLDVFDQLSIEFRQFENKIKISYIDTNLVSGVFS